MIEYRMEIVGGPFDGARGMRWDDDGEHPLPEAIYVGVCEGAGRCLDDEAYCRRRSGGKRHVYFWTADEPHRPAQSWPYGLQESYVEREDTDDAPAMGTAVYVIGGLLALPGREVAEAVPAGVERRVAAVAAPWWED